MLFDPVFNFHSRAEGFPTLFVRCPPQAGQGTARHRQPASVGGADGA